MLKDIKAKWADFVNRMNKYGIPIPTARDPKTGKGSITASLVVFSAGLFGICILFMLASAVAKLAGLFALTDLTIAQVKTAADYSFQFLLAALGAYLGRHLQKGEQTVADEVQKNLPAVNVPPQNQAAPKAPAVDDPDQQ